MRSEDKTMKTVCQLLSHLHRFERNQDFQNFARTRSSRWCYTRGMAIRTTRGVKMRLMGNSTYLVWLSTSLLKQHCFYLFVYLSMFLASTSVENLQHASDFRWTRHAGNDCRRCRHPLDNGAKEGVWKGMEGTLVTKKLQNCAGRLEVLSQTTLM